MGTPAWIPDSLDEEVDVATIWFVIITRRHVKKAASGADADKDSAGSDSHTDRLSADDRVSVEQSAVVVGSPGTGDCLARSPKHMQLLLEHTFDGVHKPQTLSVSYTDAIW